MMTCAQLTELVTDYAEGRLPWRQRIVFQLHLGMCGHCRRYLQQVRQTVRLTGQLPPEPMPPATKAELLDRFASWQVDGPSDTPSPHDDATLP
ncbi:MAG: zf-HC2 domain-containing protein [Deltaproteobacteria bacterium]|nr:zf-HC2 domain-containing protein [Deltaproteobacteria bacterium]